MRNAWSEGLLLGLGVGMLASVPGAIRASVAGAGFAVCWLALSSGAALIAGPVLGAARAARPLPAVLSTLFFGAAFAFGPLALLARVLKETTHHRPLGAVTFGILATGILLGAGLLAARCTSLALSAEPRLARLLARSFLAGGSLVSLLIALKWLGAAVRVPEFRAGLLDELLLVGLGAASLTIRFPSRFARPLRFMGPLAWLVFLAAGWLVLRSPGVMDALASKARILLGLWPWLVGR